MDDLRERMERLARRMDTAAAPDLEQARRRHTRRRRTSALTLGVALIAIVALLALQIVRTDPTTITPVDDDPKPLGTPMVWPHDDVDARWRSDPEQLLQRFAYLVLSWSDPEIVSSGAPQTYEIRPEVCPPNARCVPGLTLTVERTEGRWSVSSVTHPQLAIEVGLTDPRVALAGGGSVAFDLELPENVSAHVGLVVSNGCREATAFEVGLDSGRSELQLPPEESDDPACDDMGAGYLFAYATDDTTVPVGDPFLEAAGIEYPWITAVPIYLQMEELPPAEMTARATAVLNG